MVQSVFYESVDKAEAVNNWFNTVLDMPIGITLELSCVVLWSRAGGGL